MSIWITSFFCVHVNVTSWISYIVHYAPSFRDCVTLQLCIHNCPSFNRDLPLSPTYRWWAHLYGCLSHLTTCLRSHGGGGSAMRGLEPYKKNSGTKHSLNAGDVITDPGWAQQAAMTTSAILHTVMTHSHYQYQENEQGLLNVDFDRL